jgi:hypothetical protein
MRSTVRRGRLDCNSGHVSIDVDRINDRKANAGQDHPYGLRLGWGGFGEADMYHDERPPKPIERSILCQRFNWGY